MFCTSRTETTKPLLAMCFTHRAQHSQPGSLYTVTTGDGGAANRRCPPAIVAAAPSREVRSHSRREGIGVSREGCMKHNDRAISLARAPAHRFDSRPMAASSPTGRDRLTLHVLQ